MKKDYIDLIEKSLKQFKKFEQREFSKRSIEISSEQWIILVWVFENPGETQKEIAKSTFKDPASLTRMIDLLEKRNFIKRKTRSGDRRSYGIHLTSEGEEFVNMVLPLSKEMKSFGLKNISEKERNIFLEVLNKIYQNFD